MSYKYADDDGGLKLPTLKDLHLIPKKGFVTVCEINTQLQVAPSTDPQDPADASSFTHITDNCIPININTLKPFLPRKIPSIRTDDYGDSFLLEKEQGRLKSMWDGWKDKGITGLIGGLRKSGGPQILISTLSTALTMWNKLRNMRYELSVFFYPHLQLSTEELIERFATVRNWRRSWIRAISWHPTIDILAIALKDDSIRVFRLKDNTISLLKTWDQKMVSALSWRSCMNDLAVATENGIVIWDVDFAIKTSSSRARLLTVGGHFPVTSVDYSVSGYLLLSSSSADTSIIVWECVSGKYCALHRIGGGGIPRALWSPQFADKIFTTSPTSLFRLWVQQGTKFVSKKWTTPSKYVEAFCWGPDGKVVFFVSDCILYCINMNPAKIEFINTTINPVADPLFDLNPCFVSQLQGDLLFKVGGQVLQMIWDESGRRLALLFADSDVVAVFRVDINSANIVHPIGFIRGHDGEYPSAIAFQSGFRSGALLSIAWSTQRVQYFPMLFSESGVGNYAVPPESRRLDRHKQQFAGPPIIDHVSASKSPSSEDTPTPVFDSCLRPRNISFKLFSP